MSMDIDPKVKASELLSALRHTLGVDAEAACKAAAHCILHPGDVVRITVMGRQSAHRVIDTLRSIVIKQSLLDREKTELRNRDLNQKPGLEFLNGSAIEVVLSRW